MSTELRQVSFTYENGTQVLQNFSLCLPACGTVCLLGPSGCGKTTLLRLLAGLEVPQSGTVSAPRQTAVVFQEDRLLPWMTARRNVAAVLHGCRKENLRQAGEWLQKLNLAGSEDALPSELSGGMRQRVALARAMAFGPELLLLDEPFHALDPENRRTCMRLLHQQGQQKLTLLVTHNLEEAKQFADSMIFLQGPPLKIISKKNFR
ncbi:MAG: ATP-binding cassette domain-containing protein [Oscillospiraceae bacterium]|jgi:ABC-type nitrate/sulfonate/bicarbonate transport system ATPase subunit|nr:ATP-binding cassette domain-containing protein [Oscillospiraceae bacterium]MDD3261876.1 ATP-binding cassette domain-containing protein [Oscillospiraceae bacterium]